MAGDREKACESWRALVDLLAKRTKGDEKLRASDVIRLLDTAAELNLSAADMAGAVRARVAAL